MLSFEMEPTTKDLFLSPAKNDDSALLSFHSPLNIVSNGIAALQNPGSDFVILSTPPTVNMRSTSRLLARYLEPGVSTGLTGLWTHAAPRSALLSVYSATLAKLQRFPESSLYRQSVESLTKYRLSLVEKAIPAGYDDWATKMQKLVAENPGHFRPIGDNIAAPKRRTFFLGGKTYLYPERRTQRDVREEEWNGEEDHGPVPEGQRAAEEKTDLVPGVKDEALPSDLQAHLSSEPQLTASQVAELENSIGAGLLEEVIQVAEGELELLDVMHEAKIWESLEEKPVTGQWTYFDRTS
ncbi:hypothetical protein jhhlp_003481 [Lomentospora prolificans]|uniref:Uncharacterized protein n=1 Tax=Lomentospora prolificans TaxID=41688 RepID=A0A2N3N8V3_9PEZI|nr:hypothetical protein jhhlp_003481 [Lomentospora prolificans]